MTRVLEVTPEFKAASDDIEASIERLRRELDAGSQVPSEALAALKEAQARRRAEFDKMEAAAINGPA